MPVYEHGADGMASDDPELEEIIRRSTTSQAPQAAAQSVASTSLAAARSTRQQLCARAAAVDKEIAQLDDDIKRLQDLRTQRRTERRDLQAQLDSFGAKGAGKANGLTDFFDDFEWSAELKYQMKAVFDIADFRLAQKGVCNANMSGRDIVCVMPTGGGKSLTYQLPAIISPGCTLVISPLIALIRDQILHLREHNIEAVMLIRGTSEAEKKDIFRRLHETARRTGSDPSDIKLCYVTPERLAKSKTFMSVVQKFADAGRLARIVIDEAHCVSQLGHDFRPDYRELSALRIRFPTVPILALSATCPPMVLKDLLTTLGLKTITNGRSADSKGTVYFSSPLYRKNLHYKVLEKSSNSSDVIKTMANYILQNHRDESGIVYCLSKKDSENVAEAIKEISGGKIRTGVYHADVPDQIKESLHESWRKGAIKVVCATIAFGLGIDKADVRFVMHHSMSKSVENYYQESGRAGRDGKDAECILYYRSQDAFRFAEFVKGLKDHEKVHEMLRFAQDVKECRKIMFAKHFSTSSHLALSAWSADGSDSLTRCGHCDNCTRPPETIDERDVTLDAWRVLRVARALKDAGEKLTAQKLCDSARGVGAEAKKVDLEAMGGKVSLSKQDIMTLVIDLLLAGYLKETFHSNAHKTITYMEPGPLTSPLTTLSQAQIEGNRGQRIICAFIMPVKKGKAKATAVNGTENTPARRPRKGDLNGAGPSRSGKRKRTAAVEEVEDSFDEGNTSGSVSVYSPITKRRRPGKRSTIPSPVPMVVEDSDADEEIDDADGWTYSMTDTRRASHKSTAAGASRNGQASSSTGHRGEVIELSSGPE